MQATDKLRLVYRLRSMNLGDVILEFRKEVECFTDDEDVRIFTPIDRRPVVARRSRSQSDCHEVLADGSEQVTRVIETILCPNDERRARWKKGLQASGWELLQDPLAILDDNSMIA